MYNFEDDVEYSPYEFGDEINNKEFSESLNNLSVVSYKYLDIGRTNYHFCQNCFDNRDIKKYFHFMKILSSIPFNKLLNEKKREWHLNSNDYQRDRRFREFVNNALERTSNLKIESTPSFYHFALYTNNNASNNASRSTNIKSPRIYFFFGKDATIYPLFYDPYHKINP